MAKALFNSPRYDKKETNIATMGCLSIILYFLFSIGILSLCIFLEETYKIGNLFNYVFFPILVFVGIIIVYCESSYYKYRQYIKRINDKTKNFHTDKKTPYIVPNKKEPLEKEEIYLDLSLRLLATIMKADKEEQVVEMEIVRDFIQQSGFLDQIKPQEFKKYLKEDYAVEDVAFAIYWWFSETKQKLIFESYNPDYCYLEDRRIKILNWMFKLAYADGDFCESEEYMLRYIAYHMHLTDTEYENTLFAFLHEVYEDSFSYQVNNYMKARYKRDGGYWYRDKYGTKKWQTIQNEEDENKSESQKSENIRISPELQKAYAVLGIQVDATPSQINACKRNLLRLNHPDLVSHKGQEAVEAATSKCQAINQAYELLKANGRC